jgi:hypothetical protein
MLMEFGSQIARRFHRDALRFELQDFDRERADEFREFLAWTEVERMWDMLEDEGEKDRDSFCLDEINESDFHDDIDHLSDLDIPMGDYLDFSDDPYDY